MRKALMAKLILGAQVPGLVIVLWTIGCTSGAAPTNNSNRGGTPGATPDGASVSGHSGLSSGGTGGSTSGNPNGGSETKPDVAVPTGMLDRPIGLMTDLLGFPEKTSVTSNQPKFSWVVNDTRPNQRQGAYQILVSTSKDKLDMGIGDLWDSGKVLSALSSNVPYAGAALGEGTYLWEVRTWDGGDQVSPYSLPQIVNRAAPTSGKIAVPPNRYLVEERRIVPRRVVSIAPGQYFVEFDKTAFGTLELTLTSDLGGEKVEVALGEKRAGDHVDAKPGFDIRYDQVSLTLEKGTHPYLLQVHRGGWGGGRPDVLRTTIPFRYVEITGAPSPLTADNVTQVASFYPFDDSAAAFSSSDTKLNAIWDLSKYSIKATSWLGIYVDGDRERAPYEADAYINQLSHYASDREFTMARYSIAHLMGNATWPTEWPLHMVFMVWADYMQSGNTDLVRQYYVQLKGKLLTSQARGDGLVRSADKTKDIVDWPAPNRDGYVMTDFNTVINAFHYRTLVLMADLASVAGNAGEAQNFRDDASKVKQAFNAAFFDANSGRYVDGIGTTHVSLHANFFPLAFGLVPPERMATVVDYIKSRGMSASVYGAQYLLEALYQAGEGQAALALMAEAKDPRSWSHMIELGSTITTECWDSEYSNGYWDWNHAWGSAPANIIPRFLMGVQPIEAGFTKIRIKPQTGSLDAGHIEVPTIKGNIHVEFVSTTGSYTLTTQTPANTMSEVHLPKLGKADLSVDVDGVPTLGRDGVGDIVFEDVGSGEHVFRR